MSDNRVGFALLGAGLGAPFHAKSLQASEVADLVAVPFRELPEYATALPRVGQTIRCLLARVDQTGADVKYYNNIPTLSWNHNIWNYPTLELGK